MNIKREHDCEFNYDTGEQITLNHFKFYKGKGASPAPAPIVEPPVQNATFEAGTDTNTSLNKKKKGKSSLIVERNATATTPSTAKATTKASGLAVGV